VNTSWQCVLEETGWVQAARRIPSPNFNERPAVTMIRLIVIHNISLPPGKFGAGNVERLFTNTLDISADPSFASVEGLQVSSHFFIARHGELTQFVACSQRAWHAGRSTWRGRDGCNDFSIGIELEGTDHHPYANAQYATLADLISAIRMRHPIESILGHEHIAPGRKTDPGPNFDWRRLARKLKAPARLFADVRTARASHRARPAAQPDAPRSRHRSVHRGRHP
jgi:AmpD protein